MDWKPPDGMDRMRILAQLEQLTRGEWGDGTAARDVMLAFLTLPRYNIRLLEVVSTKTEHETHVQGLTEFGLVSVTDTQKSTDFESNNRSEKTTAARIGRFIVHRLTERASGAIEWRDYRSEEPLLFDEAPLPRWQMEYHIPTLTPYRLDRLDSVLAPLPFMALLRLFIAQIIERKRYSHEYWCFKPVTLYEQEVELEE